MGRPLSSGMLAAIAARSVRYGILADLFFPGGTSYCWSGTFTLSANGNSYLGLGPVGSIGKIEERADESVPGLSLALNGVPSSMLALALAGDYQGSPVKLWLACFDTSWSLISSPYQLFGGTMDTMAIQDGTSTGTVTLTVENRMIETQRARTRRYTDRDQRIDFPTDDAFQYVAGLQLLQIYWGNPNGPTANLPGATGVTQNLTG